MIKLQGKRVTLKEFSQEHLQSTDYFSWLRDPEIVIPIYRLEYLLPLQKDSVDQYVKSLWESGTDCFFAIHENDTDRFIGTQRIGHINWRSGLADMGVLIGDRSCWGKGYASDSIKLASSYAFDTLSLRKLTGGTPASNLGMIRCFQKNDFLEEGRLQQHLLIKGQYVDQLLFGRLKNKEKGIGHGNHAS